MNAINDILDKLQSAFSELGNAPGVSALQEGARKIEHSERVRLLVDLYLSKELVENPAHPFWSFWDSQGQDRTGTIEFNRIAQPRLPIKVLGDLFAAVAVVVCDDCFKNNRKTMDYLSRNVGQYGIIVMVNYSGEDPNWPRNLYGFLGKIIEVKPEETSGNMATFLDNVLSPPMKAKLIDRCLLNSCQPLILLTKEAISLEINHSNLRKNLQLQSSSVLKKDESAANILDLTAQIRTILQNWSTDVDKYLRTKYDDFNKPQTGRYSKISNDNLEKLSHLSEVESSVKLGKNLLVIEPSFIEGMIKNFGTQLESDFNDDIRWLQASLEAAMSKINNLLAQKNISSVTLAGASYLPPPRPQGSVASYLYIAREYKGEIMEKGGQEILVMAREYLIIPGMLSGLMAGASAFIGSAGKQGMGLVFGGLSVCCLLYGFYDMKTRLPKKRLEVMEKELKTAKENLMGEAKRMFSESSRDWTTAIGQWSKDLLAQLSAQADKNAKEFSAGQQQRLNDEKAKQQRTALNVDNIIRRLQNTDRNFENVIRSHRDGINEVDRLLRS